MRSQYGADIVTAQIWNSTIKAMQSWSNRTQYGRSIHATPNPLVCRIHGDGAGAFADRWLHKQQSTLNIVGRDPSTRRSFYVSLAATLPNNKLMKLPSSHVAKHRPAPPFRFKYLILLYCSASSENSLSGAWQQGRSLTLLCYGQSGQLRLYSCENHHKDRNTEFAHSEAECR